MGAETLVRGGGGLDGCSQGLQRGSAVKRKEAAYVLETDPTVCIFLSTLNTNATNTQPRT